MNKLWPILLVSLSLNTFAQPKDNVDKILNPFKKDLMMALKKGMKKGGPMNALSACNLKAPKISELHNKEGKLIGRTSHKVRNSNNKAQKWIGPLLEVYKTSTSAKPMSSRWVHEDKSSYYVEPIYIKPLCLRCHGEVKGELKDKITELYPEDQATGFKLGEFRGVFWVKFPKE